MSTLPEPWLRGPLDGVSPFIAPLLHSFQQAREDLVRHTASMTAAELWMRPSGAAPAGFHIRHAAGAADRLCTYLQGRELSDAQMAALHSELEPGASRQELLAQFEVNLKRVENVAKSLDAAMLGEPRFVGRKKLPTTVIGLLVHIAEHTQRHVGQAITTARIVCHR